jgi:hypothetical protein
MRIPMVRSNKLVAEFVVDNEQMKAIVRRMDQVICEKASKNMLD